MPAAMMLVKQRRGCSRIQVPEHETASSIHTKAVDITSVSKDTESRGIILWTNLENIELRLAFRNLEFEPNDSSRFRNALAEKAKIEFSKPSWLNIAIV